MTLRGSLKGHKVQPAVWPEKITDNCLIVRLPDLSQLEGKRLTGKGVCVGLPSVEVSAQYPLYQDGTNYTSSNNVRVPSALSSEC